MPDRTEGISDTLTENLSRIEAWKRSGDMGRLWPDVTAAELACAQQLLREVAESVLRGVTAPELNEREEVRPRALGIVGFTSGLGALIGVWIERGDVVASAGVRSVFADHLEHGRRRAARLTARLTTVLASLRDEGLEPTVLKGMHTGVIYFPEPGARPCSDIDLFVPPPERSLAVRALEAIGCEEVQRTLRPERSVWRAAGERLDVWSLEVDHADNPWSIDLHTSLDRFYFRGLVRGVGAAPATELIEKPSPPGGPFRVLRQPWLTAFLALHTSEDLTKMRLLRLVEIISVVRCDIEAGKLDWAELASFLRQRSLERFTYPAFALCALLAPGTIPDDVLERGRSESTKRSLTVIDAVAHEDMGPLRTRTLDNKLIWARGGRELLYNLSELAWPSDDGTGLRVGRIYLRGLRTVFRSDA